MLYKKAYHRYVWSCLRMSLSLDIFMFIRSTLYRSQSFQCTNRLPSICFCARVGAMHRHFNAFYMSFSRLVVIWSMLNYSTDQIHGMANDHLNYCNEIWEFENWWQFDRVSNCLLSQSINYENATDLKQQTKRHWK